MDPLIITIIVALVCLVAGILLGKIVFAKNTQKQLQDAESQAQSIVREAELRAETIKKEKQLEAKTPAPFRVGAHHWLILLGRYICKARTPECWRCPVQDLCSFRPKSELKSDKRKTINQAGDSGAHVASSNRHLAARQQRSSPRKI